MSNEQQVNGQVKQGEPVRMDMLLKEYEIAFQDVLRENLMLKALLAQKRAEESKGTE